MADGSVQDTFNPLPADGTLVYVLDPGVDPIADVLSLPEASTFLARGSPPYQRPLDESPEALVRSQADGETTGDA